MYGDQLGEFVCGYWGSKGFKIGLETTKFVLLSVSAPACRDDLPQNKKGKNALNCSKKTLLKLAILMS